MKRSVKFILLLFLIVICFSNNIVLAGVNHGYSSSYVNECADNHSCILLCAYTNEVKVTAEWVDPPNYNYFSSYVYYNINEKNFFVEWISQETDINLATHDNLLGHKYVKIENSIKDNLTNYGKCPKYSFVDVAGMSLASEVCFSDDTIYCTSTASDAGTKFKGDSSLKYNYEEHIDKYFENWSPDLSKYSCQDLQNKNIDIETQFVTDFSKNYLYGNSIPNFMGNSSSFKNGRNSLDNKIDDLEIECNEEAQKQLENEEITQEEYDDIVEKNEQGADELHEQVDNAIEKIEVGTSNFGNNITEITKCESLLGKPGDENSPAWYLSLVFSIIRYVAIILLIVLTIIDFVGAVTSQDNDILKKSMTKAIKRAIICVVIFVLPILIDFVLQFIHDSSVSDCINLNS